jgi:mono/diheme cytochrome c family protein
MKDVLLAAAFASAFLAQLPDPSIAQTPAEAYIKGCAGCHSSEGPEPERRAWIEKFMTQHPCERDDLKLLIATYLLEKSAR